MRLYWRLSFLIKITSLRHFLFDGLGRNSPGQIQRSVPHTNDFIWKAKGTKGRGLCFMDKLEFMQEIDM